MYRIFEKIIISDDDEINKSLKEKISKGKEFMTSNGFQEIVVEDFCDLVNEILENCLKKEYDICQLYKPQN